ncbi:hypothetical protein PPTG_24865 [Phytophthora nicotianae INRA-310]|uniref:Uncharacterized protein n=1 Tax=Phytophthora nicotianae (strain INRA-310) TaxID=761204 RepID=W2P9G0_PHYN3|nr:hypothetical protein PPTG_24865 [Phytophthora nicotianae INRA-310]ETM97682.1 hypothetical protein PPTG_24865 [Phytophthora nicotianae INRA-310]
MDRAKWKFKYSPTAPYGINECFHVWSFTDSLIASIAVLQ